MKKHIKFLADHGYHHLYDIATINNGSVSIIQRDSELFVGKLSNVTSFNSRLQIYNELHLMKMCNCKNIVSCVDFFQNDDFACIVMPKYQQRNIFDYLEENSDKLRNFICDISNGLQHLHSLHIIHRDLNPSNIFIDYDENFIIGDLGCANLCFKNNCGLYQTQKMVGAIGYRAPEMLGRFYGKEVDLWNFGLVLHEIQYGCLPFEFENEVDFIWNLKRFSFRQVRFDEVDQLIATLLHRNGEERMEYVKYVSKL